MFLHCLTQQDTMARAKEETDGRVFAKGKGVLPAENKGEL